MRKEIGEPDHEGHKALLLFWAAGTEILRGQRLLYRKAELKRVMAESTLL
jgi:hypothetical protein